MESEKFGNAESQPYIYSLHTHTNTLETHFLGLDMSNLFQKR